MRAERLVRLARIGVAVRADMAEVHAERALHLLAMGNLVTAAGETALRNVGGRLLLDGEIAADLAREARACGGERVSDRARRVERDRSASGFALNGSE